MYNLEHVLEKLEKAGLTLKKSKCIFTATSVEYLGHIIENMAYIRLCPKYKQLSNPHNQQVFLITDQNLLVMNFVSLLKTMELTTR